jgi:hypothetical protein
MVIELGVAQVFERHMPQASYGFVRRQLARLHLLEEAVYGFGIHPVRLALGLHARPQPYHGWVAVC